MFCFQVAHSSSCICNLAVRLWTFGSKVGAVRYSACFERKKHVLNTWNLWPFFCKFRPCFEGATTFKNRGHYLGSRHFCTLLVVEQCMDCSFKHHSFTLNIALACQFSGDMFQLQDPFWRGLKIFRDRNTFGTKFLCISLGFQTPWGWRYLDPKNIPKTPNLRRSEWKTRVRVSLVHIPFELPHFFGHLNWKSKSLCTQSSLATQVELDAKNIFSLEQILQPSNSCFASKSSLGCSS